MKDVNKLILIGRLGADPVMRTTKNGVPVVHFPVATSRRIKSSGPDEVTDSEMQPQASDRDDGRTEETQWHRVVAWGRQGEICSQYLKKGETVFVEGMVRTRKFDGRDGAERIAFEVHAENVIFLSRGGRPTSDVTSIASTVIDQAG